MIGHNSVSCNSFDDCTYGDIQEIRLDGTFAVNGNTIITTTSQVSIDGKAVDQDWLDADGEGMSMEDVMRLHSLTFTFTISSTTLTLTYTDEDGDTDTNTFTKQ